ncbi:MAG: universal stress protein [Cyclobacteriaceae bacterium]
MKKILVPVDFSKASLNALDVAVDIANKTGASIVALHVVEDPGTDSFRVSGEVVAKDWMDKIYLMKLLEKSRAQLKKLVMDAKYASVKVDGELRVGNPFHGMRTIITEHKVDLVVMGTRGHSRLEEVVIGSNTEKVVRHAKCPVLTIHKKPGKLSFKNIVWATSMAKDEEVFARILKTAQNVYKAKIHLVRINTPGDFQRDRVALEYMEKFAKKLGLDNYTLNVYNDITEEEGIIYFSDKINADLIAMATHGRTGFAHVLAGSIAEDVVNHAKRPVLTFVVKH